MSNILDSSEISKLIPLAMEFIAESGEDIPFNAEHFKATWETLLASKAGHIIKCEKNGEIVGALGFLVYHDILSGELKASETFWFMKPSYRGSGVKLLEEFEYTAKNMGVKRIMMAHLKNLMPEKIKSVYLSRGYKEIETQYERVI